MTFHFIRKEFYVRKMMNKHFFLFAFVSINDDTETNFESKMKKEKKK